MRICVYTCITGRYDDLKEIEFKNDSLDYLCFTNNKSLQSKSWKIVYVEEELDDLLLQKKIKICCHKYLNNYDASLYIDGKVLVRKDVLPFIQNNLKEDIDLVGFKHPIRNCIYDEIYTCILYEKEKLSTGRYIRDKYRQEGFPAHYGLSDNAILLRRHTERVAAFMEFWLDMVKTYSRRDQLSFFYCLWKMPISTVFLDDNIENNEFFLIDPWHHAQNSSHKKVCLVDFNPEESYDIDLLKEIEYTNGPKETIIQFDVPVTTDSVRIRLDELGNQLTACSTDQDLQVDLINGIHMDNGFIFMNQNHNLKISGYFEKNRTVKLKLRIKELSRFELICLLQNALQQAQSKDKQIEMIQNTRSYRLGRAFTWVPRKLRGGVRCYREHGLPYTCDRLLIHLRLKEDPLHPPIRDYAYYSTISPRKYPRELKLWYKQATGDDLNLQNPKTVNEKIQWMKLYDSTPLKTRLADKYLVREWVKEKIGEEYLIPLLGVWDHFDEIDFDKLPDQFVLKANHGSGWNIIVKDKSLLDQEAAKKKFDVWMKTNYAFITGLELHYLNIPPKIIAEKYIENLDQLIDYKVWCADGKARFVWVDTDRFTNHKRTLFSLDWERLPITLCDYHPTDDREIPRPKNLEKMICFAEELSKDFAQVRVDFYEVDDKLYFGEMTFTSSSGVERANPRTFENEMGSWITLPPKSPVPKRRY